MARRPSAFSALIAIDKPAGMTSHDVVSRVRRAVGERRVGHAGTLDPAATGVLVVGIGQATKLLGLLTLDRKGYRATFRLGAQTTTDDAEGEVLRTAEVPGELLDGRVAAARVAALVGEQDQVPPAFSAVSVGGRRAYDAARSGEALELKPRRVRVYDARLLGVDPEERSWELELDVSKGTYVRSIARDLGRDLGCYAHVSALRRSFSGPVTLADCLTLEELEAGGAALAQERALDPVTVLGLAERPLDVAEISAVSNGRPIPVGRARGRYAAQVPTRGERVCLTWDHALVGIWERRGGQLACQANFPQGIVGVEPPLALVGPEDPLGPAALARLAGEALAPAWAREALDESSRAFALPGLPVSGTVLVRGAGEGGVDAPASGEPPAGPSTACEPADEPPAFDPAALLGPDRRFVCAIGAFDGLHRGHRALLARARRRARALGCRLAAVTFSPDPSRVLPGTASADLLGVPDRGAFLLAAGVDALVTIDFTPELADLPYERFVREGLGALMDLRAVVVGEDFRLGAGGRGDVVALRALGEEDGFEVEGMALADEGGSAITASRARALLAEGRVEAAAALLGRCHYVTGRVEHGRGEGTGFGFPTANVRVREGACLPAEGVYAGLVCVGGAGNSDTPGDPCDRLAYPAAINVGKPRTFSLGEEGAAFLEATLLGFSGDLYDEEVSVVFCRWLREPRAFSSLEELERTVLANIDWVRGALGEAGVPVMGPRPRTGEAGA